MVVNVYGTRDILADLKINDLSIGGYRENIGGFEVSDRNKPLVNIEIVGASHFDYMRRESVLKNLAGVTGWSSGKLLDFLGIADSTWNGTVSDFVADMVANSQDVDTLERFMSEMELEKKAYKEGDKWIVKLPGYEKYK